MDKINSEMYLRNVSVIILLLSLIMHVKATLPEEVPTNYTSLVLNYLSDEYPNQEIKVERSNTYKHPETGIEYTYILAKHEGKKISLVVTHKDNKVYDSQQIRKDYILYLESLPQAYRKLGSTLRKKIRDKFNSLPQSNNIESDEIFDVEGCA